MARNRKNQPAAIRFGPAIKALLLCSMIVCSCVGYVWLKQQIDELGQQMKKREALRLALREQNDKLRRQLASLESVQFLEQRVKELNLGLVPPQPDQIWRLPEPPAEPAEAPEQQLAAEQNRGPATP